MKADNIITADKLSYSSVYYIVTCDDIREIGIESLEWNGALQEFCINSKYRCRRKDTSAFYSLARTRAFFNRIEAESYQIQLRNELIEKLGKEMDEAIIAYNKALEKYDK